MSFREWGRRSPDPSPDVPTTPPPRPPEVQERRAAFLFRALSPRLKKVEPNDPPPELEPLARFDIERSRGPGRLAATWYPARGAAPTRPTA